MGEISLSFVECLRTEDKDRLVGAEEGGPGDGGGRHALFYHKLGVFGLLFSVADWIGRFEGLRLAKGGWFPDLSITLIPRYTYAAGKLFEKRLMQ